MKDRKKVATIGVVIILFISAVFFLYTQFFSSPAKADVSTSYLQTVFTSMFGVVADNTVVLPARLPQQEISPTQLASLDGFAQCLTNQGLKMYGIPPCPSCAEQKRLFGSSFKYITYIDCESKKETCQQKNIRGYPTWEFGDGRMISGIVPLEYFEGQTGCNIN